MKAITKELNNNYTEVTSLGARLGQRVTLHGRIYKIRVMSGFAFVILRTGGSFLQCVCHLPMENLVEGAWVRLVGDVVEEPRSKAGFEVRILGIELLSLPAEEPPVVVNNKEVNASLSTLLDYRPLTLRNEKETAVFKVQAEICKGIRSFLDGQGFVEIHTPKIVGGNAEGGANVFGLDYFGKPAFLAQSPQFYKQTMVAVFERVYEIAPVFRAEKHHTARHINEYTSVDLEMGFIHSFRDLMALETAMLGSVFEHLEESCEKELALWKVELPRVDAIPAIPFGEAKAWVAREYGRPIADFEDFEPEEERLLGELVKKETGGEFVFVTHYKTSKRPFYAMETPGNPEVTESFDLLFRGMEITTGGQRIHDYRKQVEKMERLEMETRGFESYLMAHKYGLPPHGGMGIGLERLTARLFGFDNLRRAALFPRDTERLMP